MPILSAAKLTAALTVQKYAPTRKVQNNLQISSVLWIYNVIVSGTDSCQKDSGGSLYWTYSGRQYTIGIVSYGTFCAGAYPSVNTRVTSYITWIEDQLAGAFICKK